MLLLKGSLRSGVTLLTGDLLPGLTPPRTPFPQQLAQRGASPELTPSAAARGLLRTAAARTLGWMLPDSEGGLGPVSSSTEHLRASSQLRCMAALGIFFPRNILGSKYKSFRLP